LLEQTVNLKIEEAFPKLKATLIEKGYRVLTEEPPRQICFKQGSLWGVTPKTAKKIVKINLQPNDDGATVRCSSQLAPDWKNITLIGCAFALILVGLCVWMATDLNTVLATHQSSFWSWLIMVGSSVDSTVAQTFINLTWALAVFLLAIIFLEGAIVIYVHYKIDMYTRDLLNQLG